MRGGISRALLLVFILGGCDDIFEYSPNQYFDQDSPVGLNEINLRKLAATVPDDTITIAFVGDSQRFYDEADDFIEAANQIESIDFLLLAGDISDFGLLEEFEQIEDLFEDFNKPYIAVIGNHDVMAKGEQTYERMFGPLNFSFVYDSVKFLAHNTNGREYPEGQVPDMQWLRKEFGDTPGVNHFVTVSHVPPFSNDFDKSLEIPYTDLIHQKNTLVSLHGHTHEYKVGYPYNDGILYITTHSFEARSFVLLKIHSGRVSHTVIDY